MNDNLPDSGVEKEKAEQDSCRTAEHRCAPITPASSQSTWRREARKRRSSPIRRVSPQSRPPPFKNGRMTASFTATPTFLLQAAMPPLAFALLILLLEMISTSAASAPPSAEVNMGTTILAVRYRDGVVVGADTRTSVSGYVSNRFASKLTFVLNREVDSFVVGGGSTMTTEDATDDATADDGSVAAAAGDGDGTDAKRDERSPPPPPMRMADASTCVICRSGSAADTQYLADEVRYELVSRQLARGMRGTVTHAARLLRALIVDEPDLTASLICAGYDHVLGRGVIYAVSPGGTLFEEPFCSFGGSGSAYIMGHIDAAYADNTKGELWNEKEAVEFVGRAIELAMERDGSSGGFVRLFVIDRGGRRSFLRMPRSALASMAGTIGVGEHGEEEEVGTAGREEESRTRAPRMDLPNFAPPSAYY